MQKGAAIGLRTALPSCRLKILTPNIEQDLRAYSEDFDEVARTDRKNPILMLSALTSMAIARKLNVNPVVFSNDLSEILASDVVVFTNGDMFTEDSGVLVGLTHIIPMLLALMSKKKYFLLGQSIGKFNKLTPIARKIICGAEGIYVRESDSLDYVLSIAPEAKNKVMRTGDLAFLAHRVCTDPGPTSLARQASPKKIGISLSNLFSRHIQKNQGMVEEAAINLLLESLKVVKSRFDADFVFVPHVGARGKRDDFPLSRRLREELGGEIIRVRTSEEAARVFESCSLTIASRMHANIASLAVGTPTIALSYSHKSEGMMANFGLRHLVLLSQDFNGPRLTELCESALDEGTDMSKKILTQAKIEADLAEKGILNMISSMQ
ncbi:polysaccharide pyruvyl transferase family protein [Aquiluna sp.]|nr:polysaccharide pyruvyl transferase family protein [Aquiluna sp.]